MMRGIQQVFRERAAGRRRRRNSHNRSGKRTGNTSPAKGMTDLERGSQRCPPKGHPALRRYRPPETLR